MAIERPDLLVIGGGAAGLSAAFAARYLGRSVTIVQDGPIGGDCTFTGCVPSKALLSAAGAGLDFAAAMERVRGAVDQIAADESAPVLAARGIDVVTGRGRFVDPRTVDVDGQRLSSERIVVAAGSTASVPPIPGLVDVPHLTNHDLFQLDRLPRRLGIIGGGPIGCEMAEAFSNLGSAVVVVEGAERLLPRDDRDAAAVVEAALVRRGVEVRTGATVDAVSEVTGGIALTIGDDSVEVDEVLVATGRAPSLESLDLEAAGVELTPRGWIRVDEHLQTTAEGVYASGDVVGSLQLTHAAGAMSQVAVTNAFGHGLARFKKRTWEPRSIGWVTFTSPEVAQLGVTEAEAAEIDGARVASLDLARVDRAVAVGKTEGFVKLIAAPRRLLGNTGGGRLIGATIVAERAGEMVGELTLLMQRGMFVGRLAQTPHPYPSWSIALGQVASQFFSDAVTGESARAPRP